MAPSGDDPVAKSHCPEEPCAHLLRPFGSQTNFGTTESLQELANVLTHPAWITPDSARGPAPSRLRHSHQGVRKDRVVRRVGPRGHGRGAEAGVLRPKAVAVLLRPTGRGVGLDRTDARGGPPGRGPST